MGRAQQDNCQSQYSQYPSGDGSLPSSSMYDSQQELNEAVSTSPEWNPQRTRQALVEGDGADMGCFNHNQDMSQTIWQQATHPSYNEPATHDQGLWSAQSQYMASSVYTLEAQPSRSWQDESYQTENLIELSGYTASHLQPPPRSPHAPEHSSQDQTVGFDMSLLSVPTTAHRTMSNVKYPYYLSGMSPALPAQDAGCPETSDIESFMNEMNGMKTDAQPEPWSGYVPNEMLITAQQDHISREAYDSRTSDTTPSTFEYDHSSSSPRIVDDSLTHNSSFDLDNSGMNESMMTVRPEPGNPNFQMPLGTVSYLDFTLRHATPPVGLPNIAIGTGVSETG
ncbi:hypothetical protein G6011_10023 [Alternaria panax]|uniref:Uncharacterized protein n=1 Tax=Alternaria panax TaxID=48097 RepID=A0AAD4I2W7_9PLEO|nr:hypothetical protein G6011_10023 [Alternaria panax]